MRNLRPVIIRSLSAASVWLAIFMMPSLLQAHVVMLNPPARSSDTDLTVAPCGEIPPGQSMATFSAGANIDINSNLAVRHTNLLFAAISFDNFATRTQLGNVTTPRAGRYKINVTLPDGPPGPAVLQVTDGTYVSCADISLSDEAVFEINAGVNDAWYFPGTDGQGFFIIVYPDIQLLYLAWFTYDVERPAEEVEAILGDSGHRWITAAGPYAGDTAMLDITVTSGGVFDMGEPVPENSAPGSVGTMEVTFVSCTSGLVKYNMPGLGLAGEVPIQRVVNDNVALCEALDAQ
jgi:hypothetical protein